jgi:hypothetical protein
MKFVADNQPAEPVQPGEQPLDHSAAQRSAVLSLAPVLTVGRDHFDSVFLIKMSVDFRQPSEALTDPLSANQSRESGRNARQNRRL